MSTPQKSSSYSTASDIKQRKQWICWREEQRNGKLTKVPTDIAGYDIDATDSDNWMSYEQANKATSTSNVDGIGFVFDSDGFVVGIDIDDCRDPDTEDIDDWAQEIIDRLDTYWEVSPSGTGLHALVFGILPGDGGKADIPDADGHIEMYEKGRFFTFTGDEIDESTGTVERETDEIRSIYNEYFQDADTAQNDDNNEIEEHDSEYDDIQISVHEVLDKDIPEEERVTHPIHGSSTGANFMIDDGGETWRCWSAGHECTGNALHLIGMQHDVIDCGEWVNDGLTDEQWSKILSYAEGRGFDVTRQTIPEDIHTDLCEAYGQYGYWTETDDGDAVWEPLTTFRLELNAILEDEHTDETKLDLTVLPSSDDFESYDIVTTPEVFNDVHQFRAEICTGPSTSYRGGIRDLHKLRKVVVHQDAPRRTSTSKVGLHNNQIVTPNGVITDGETPRYRYEPTGRAIDAKWQLNPDELNYDEEAVAEIMELLPQTRAPERFLPVLGWWYAALFAPYIREQEGEIAQMMVSGDTGSGKTSTISMLAKMVGLDGNPRSANDTSFATLKKLSSTTNIPVWLDEYKPSEMRSRRLDTLQDYLRKTTRGGEETRGNADQSVTRYVVNSPVILSGEQEVQGAAEQRRFLRTQFRSDVTDDGTETAKAFAQLTGSEWKDSNGNVEVFSGHDLREHAKAVYQFLLEYENDTINECWNTAVEQAYEIVGQTGATGLSDIEITGLAMIRFGTAVYRHIADRVGAKDPLDDSDVNDAMRYIARTMGDTRESHVDEFLRLVSLSDPTPDDVYRVDNDDNLRVNVTKAHHEVSQYLQDHDLDDSYDLLNRPRDYAKRMRDMMDDATYVLDEKNDHIVNRCFVIDLDEVEDAIHGFDASAFF